MSLGGFPIVYVSKVSQLNCCALPSNFLRNRDRFSRHRDRLPISPSPTYNNPCPACFQNLVLPVDSTSLDFLLVAAVLVELELVPVELALALVLVLADLVVEAEALAVLLVLADLILRLLPLVLDSA